MFYGLSDGRLGQPISVHSFAKGRAVYALYGLGFAAISLEIALLYRRAWQLRAPLRLNNTEKFITRGAIRLLYLDVREAVDYAKFYSHPHNAVIRVYDAAGKLIEIHKHKGDFRG